MAKQFDICLPGAKKSFDISVGERVRKCDFLIYYLTFHDSLTVESAIFLESDIQKILSNVFCGGESEIGLSVKAVPFLQSMFFLAESEITFAADTDLLITYGVEPEPLEIGIGTADSAKIVPMLPVSGHNEIGIGASDIYMVPCKTLGEMEPIRIGILAGCEDASLKGFLYSEAEIALGAEIRAIQSLKYIESESTKIGIGASLGSLAKIEVIDVGQAEICAIGFSCAADAELARYRKLGEIDYETEYRTLADIDNNTLRTLDITYTTNGGEST